MDKKDKLFSIIVQETGFSNVLELSYSSSDVEGWDSISHLFIVARIEEEFGKNFTVKEIESWKTISDILNSINGGS